MQSHAAVELRSEQMQQQGGSKMLSKNVIWPKLNKYQRITLIALAPAHALQSPCCAASVHTLYLTEGTMSPQLVQTPCSLVLHCHTRHH